jgi:hypothetical protein
MPMTHGRGLVRAGDSGGYGGEGVEAVGVVSGGSCCVARRAEGLGRHGLRVDTAEGHAERPKGHVTEVLLNGQTEHGGLR